MGTRKIRVSRYYRGIIIDNSYSGNLLKLTPVEKPSISATGQPYKEKVVVCKYSTDEIVGRNVKTREWIDGWEDKVRACLSLIARVPTIVRTISERVNGHPIRRTFTVKMRRKHRRLGTASAFVKYARKRSDEHRLLLQATKLDAEALKAWDEASLYLMKSTMVKNDEWITALRWLRKSFDSSDGYDKLTAAWIAYNSLFSQLRSSYIAYLQANGVRDIRAPEEELIKYFVEQRMSPALCRRFVLKHKNGIRQLAKSEPELTKFHTNPNKRRTQNLLTKLRTGAQPIDVVKALLVVIYSIRNNIFHASWTYEDSLYEADVSLAHGLLSKLLTWYFFLETTKRLPSWQNVEITAMV